LIPSTESTPPTPVSNTVAPSNLPAMNQAASQSSSDSGEQSCGQPKKSWFAIQLTLVDERNAESAAGDITIDLKIPDLGEVERISPSEEKPIKIEPLNPGGTGEVVEMTHATIVFEAIGDFA
jgi:hypothetical protein